MSAMVLYADLRQNSIRMAIKTEKTTKPSTRTMIWAAKTLRHSAQCNITLVLIA